MFPANQALLRTLLSYCSLQGAGGGALASVRMELILLLQVREWNSQATASGLRGLAARRGTDGLSQCSLWTVWWSLVLAPFLYVVVL